MSALWAWLRHAIRFLLHSVEVDSGEIASYLILFLYLASWTLHSLILCYVVVLRLPNNLENYFGESAEYNLQKPLDLNYD